MLVLSTIPNSHFSILNFKILFGIGLSRNPTPLFPSLESSALPIPMAEEGEGEEEVRRSIYKTCRSIKKRENSIYNALRSIYEDSIFVSEIAHLWPELPLLANLRCGLWYSSKFHSTCYFKSTDGHTNNLSFSTARLNLHVATLAGQKRGCIVVDSTRRGKRFPDSMSKTIPIWACVLNRAIMNRLGRMSDGSGRDGELEPPNTLDWDCSLHLPLWVSKTEIACIENRLEEWTKQFEHSGADIDSLVLSLRKPLRPMWISQKTVIWLNEVPVSDSWDFTPIILVSASSPTGRVQQSSISEFSWNYIPGAGDDEESWARGLSPDLFWKHAFEIISNGPDLCNQKVAELVEKDRVYRSQKGEDAPQLTIKFNKSLESKDDIDMDRTSRTTGQLSEPGLRCSSTILKTPCQQGYLFWIGTTNLAIGTTSNVENVLEDVDCILNCDCEPASFSSKTIAYLHVPILTSKVDRFSLLNSLHIALNFASIQLNKRKKLLICCHSGEDVSVCVCLAILTSLFDEAGCFDGGKTFMESCITKWEMRRRLIFICKYAISARPSRGNLRQVFCFLNRGKEFLKLESDIKFI